MGVSGLKKGFYLSSSAVIDAVPFGEWLSASIDFDWNF